MQTIISNPKLNTDLSESGGDGMRQKLAAPCSLLRGGDRGTPARAGWDSRHRSSEVFLTQRQDPEVPAERQTRAGQQIRAPMPTANCDQPGG